MLRLDEFGDTLQAVVPANTAGGGARALEDVEREHILRTLEACHWRVKGQGNAAAQLKLHPNTLQSRMKKLGIRRPAPARPGADSVSLPRFEQLLPAPRLTAVRVGRPPRGGKMGAENTKGLAT